MKKSNNIKIRVRWGDEIVLPNGQILQPKMMTPEESRELNTCFMPAWQREFNDGKRDGYVKAMKAGIWDNDNISIIRLTKDGEVCDGGHRTSAAERAGFTLCTLLIKNVPAKVFLSTDTQKTRDARVFISGADKNLLCTLSMAFYRATMGFFPINAAGSGSDVLPMNPTDPAAFLHANREEIESYAKISSCMRSRCKDTISGKMFGIVAAVARAKSGNDSWVYSLTNTSPCIVDIKDYVVDAKKKGIARGIQNGWIFCRLMSDFREKVFNGPRWHVRNMLKLQDEFGHALKGHFKMPTQADYDGAAEDLFALAQKEEATKKGKNND